LSRIHAEQGPVTTPVISPVIPSVFALVFDGVFGRATIAAFAAPMASTNIARQVRSHFVSPRSLCRPTNIEAHDGADKMNLSAT
jgi:hypothetical protein